MTSRIDRLRRRINIKKRSQSTPIKASAGHCQTPDTAAIPASPFSLEYDDEVKREVIVTVSEANVNATPGIATPSNNLDEDMFKSAPAPAAVTPQPEGDDVKISFEKQQPLIVPKEREASVELLSMPSITAYSTVNYFEPSEDEHSHVDAHTCACDKINAIQLAAQSQPPQVESSNFGYIEFSMDEMDDVSDIESPDHFSTHEEERNVCFQSFKEGLCHSASNDDRSPDDLDNDIISLPHLTVNTPEEGDKSKGRNDSKGGNRRSSHMTFCTLNDESFQTYLGDSYNDIIQALSNNMKECGLNESIDDIRNGLFR